MMNAEPLKEHRWLEGLVGDWTYESGPCGEPGQEPTKFTGTESVRSMGGGGSWASRRARCRAAARRR